jgi:YesN/AraC family two-component response regulator
MSDKLQRLIDSIGIELWNGHLHLIISGAIDDTLHVQGPSSPLLAVASTFFLQSLRAHWNEACLGIAKMLDRQKGTATLWRMLEQAEAQAGAFCELSPSQVRQSCAEWEERVRQMESRCGLLKERRNKVIAHLELRPDGKVIRARTQRIPYEDLLGFYKQAIGITNELAKCYKGDKAMLISLHTAELCKEELRRVCQILSVQRGRQNE